MGGTEATACDQPGIFHQNWDSYFKLQAAHTPPVPVTPTPAPSASAQYQPSPNKYCGEKLNSEAGIDMNARPNVCKARCDAIVTCKGYQVTNAHFQGGSWCVLVDAAKGPEATACDQPATFQQDWDSYFKPFNISRQKMVTTTDAPKAAAAPELTTTIVLTTTTVLPTDLSPLMMTLGTGVVCLFVVLAIAAFCLICKGKGEYHARSAGNDTRTVGTDQKTDFENQATNQFSNSQGR